MNKLYIEPTAEQIDDIIVYRLKEDLEIMQDNVKNPGSLHPEDIKYCKKMRKHLKAVLGMYQ